VALLVTFNQVIERVTMARTMNLPDPSILGREQNLCSQVRNRIHRRQNQSSSGLELLRRRFRQIALCPAGAHETEASALLFGPSNSVCGMRRGECVAMNPRLAFRRLNWKWSLPGLVLVALR